MFKTSVHKASKAICDYLGPVSQESSVDAYQCGKEDKKQYPVKEDECEDNENFIDTYIVFSLPNDIKRIFDLLKQSTTLAYRAKCWPKMYETARICWNTTSQFSCYYMDMKLESKVVKVIKGNTRKLINRENEKCSTHTQIHNTSVLEVMNYLKEYTNRRALAKIVCSCWFMLADNIIDFIQTMVNNNDIHCEGTSMKTNRNIESSHELHEKIWQPEKIDNEFNIDWNWLHNFILKTLEILCRASKWESLVQLGLKAVGVFGKRWGPSILPFIIFGQMQILERLNKQKTTEISNRDIQNIELRSLDFTNSNIRSQMQLYSAWYHFNILQSGEKDTSKLSNIDLSNRYKEMVTKTFFTSLTPKNYVKLMNQCKISPLPMNHWIQNTEEDIKEKTNFDWIDFEKVKGEVTKPKNLKICKRGWLIPQSYLSGSVLNSDLKKIKLMQEEELALYNILVPLNTDIMKMN
ncbi:unnamed protein product [Heterobilharzia americana]|nr:unnamed protein product [Heterobilharzia americana]